MRVGPEVDQVTSSYSGMRVGAGLSRSHSRPRSKVECSHHHVRYEITSHDRGRASTDRQDHGKIWR